MRKCLISICTLLLAVFSLKAEPAYQIPDSTSLDKKTVRDTLVGEFSDEYLDTVKLAKKQKPNNYFMIGVDYGVSFLNSSFNPSKNNRAYVFCPNYIDVMFTHYEKMFGYIANFCFRTGFAYAHEGYSFKTDPDTGSYLGNVDGCTKAVIELLEIPFLAGFHVDFAPLKIQAEVGPYLGYRKSIEREGSNMDQEFTNKFHDYEFRFDYGLRGGAGIAFMIDPIELHFNAIIRWGWQSYYKPDYNSAYYYRYAYPLDFTVSAGIHFQLTKRSGKTNRMLKKEAKEIVYGKDENN